MRTRWILTMVFYCGLSGVLGLASCYNPGDLGDRPFKCDPANTQCPDGYTCDTNSADTGQNKTPPTYGECIMKCTTDNDCPYNYFCDVQTHTFCVIECAQDSDCPSQWEICDTSVNYCSTVSCTGTGSNSCPNGEACDPIEKTCFHSM